jgi:type IV pilus assembly protein PilC
MATKAATAPATDKALVFTWEGTDRRGKRVKGESRASNIAMARADLRRQGITPIKVRRKSSVDLQHPQEDHQQGHRGLLAPAGDDDVGRGADGAGLRHRRPRPLNPAMQEMILAIKADVEGGTSLTASLRKYPIYFDDLFCNLVEAGEQAGVLENLLDKIATYKEKTESLKGKIKKALFYPVAVIVVAIVITAVIMIFVIPQFKDLFSSFGADLPAFTRVVINISDFVASWWWAILAGVAAAIFAMSNIWKRSPKFRETLDRLLLKIPVIGGIMHRAALARFCRTTATMFTAGVPLVEALESVAGATGSTVYERAVLTMRDDVATGQSLTLAMRQQGLFPHMVIQMVTIGEESGALDDMLSKVADFYEEEVDNAVDALSSLLEPLIMVVLGTVIGSLVVALYLPIFQLGSVVSGR